MDALQPFPTRQTSMRYPLYSITECLPWNFFQFALGWLAPGNPWNFFQFALGWLAPGNKGISFSD
jgi:hypothetical protein